MTMSNLRDAEPASSPVSSQAVRADEAAGPMLEARFRRSFAAGTREFAVDVDFSAVPGFTILFGASGAGKTTLLDCVAGLVKPETGRIAVTGEILFDSEKRINLPVAKRRVGYVFQN